MARTRAELHSLWTMEPPTVPERGPRWGQCKTAWLAREPVFGPGTDNDEKVMLFYWKLSISPRWSGAERTANTLTMYRAVASIIFESGIVIFGSLVWRSLTKRWTSLEAKLKMIVKLNPEFVITMATVWMLLDETVGVSTWTAWRHHTSLIQPI